MSRPVVLATLLILAATTLASADPHAALAASNDPIDGLSTLARVRRPVLTAKVKIENVLAIVAAGGADEISFSTGLIFGSVVDCAYQWANIRQTQPEPLRSLMNRLLAELANNTVSLSGFSRDEEPTPWGHIPRGDRLALERQLRNLQPILSKMSTALEDAPAPKR